MKYALRLLWFVGSIATMAQSEAEQPPVRVLVEETVSRQQSGDPPSVVEKSIGDDAREQTLEQALHGLPGLVLAERANPAQGPRLIIRGAGARTQFGVRGSKVMLDDVPLTFADGQSQTDTIILSGIDQIELIRGPASSLYGNAAAGVLRFRTFFPDKETGSVSILADENQLSLSAGYGRPITNGAVRFDLEVEDGSQFRDHSAFRTYKTRWVFRRYWGDTKVHGGIHLYDAPFLMNPGSLTKADAEADPTDAHGFTAAQGSGKKTAQHLAHLGFTRPLWGGAWRASLFAGIRDLYNPIPTRVIDLGRRFGGLRQVWEKPFSSGDQWLIGLDFAFQTDQRRESENLGTTASRERDELDQIREGRVLEQAEERVYAYAPFVQWTRHWSDVWSTEAAVRYDRFLLSRNDLERKDNRDLDAWSPRLALQFSPLSNQAFYLQWNTAFLTPTVSELGNRADGSPGFNPLLSPERPESLELGGRGRLGDWMWSAAAYYGKTKDMLIPFQTENAGVTYFRNAGEVRNQGWELYLGRKPDQGFGFYTMVMVNQMRFRDYPNSDQPTSSNFRGNEVPGAVPRVIQAAFSYRAPRLGTLFLRGTKRSGYWADDANGGELGDPGSRVDGYTKADLGYERTIGNDKQRLNWSFSATLENVFDQTYTASVTVNAFGKRYFEPGQGRNLSLGLRVRQRKP